MEVLTCKMAAGLVGHVVLVGGWEGGVLGLDRDDDHPLGNIPDLHHPPCHLLHGLLRLRHCQALVGSEPHSNRYYYVLYTASASELNRRAVSALPQLPLRFRTQAAMAEF